MSRWLDVPFTREESLQADKTFKINCELICGGEGGEESLRRYVCSSVRSTYFKKLCSIWTHSKDMLLQLVKSIIFISSIYQYCTCC